jgi:two-component system response regulator FixJ
MSHKPTIFIVDDNEEVASALETVMRFAGFEDISIYNRSDRFLDNAPLEDGDCVLLDMQMPEIDGLEVQRRLNARRRKIGVIIITGHGNIPMAVDAMRAGAIDFIEKPFSNETLINSVQCALAHA